MKWLLSAVVLVFLMPPLAAQQVGDATRSTLELIPGQTVDKVTGRTVTYQLSVGDTTVNFTGKPTPALATNGSIPAPTLRFTEGDSARIYVTNRTEGTVSFHWHGLLLPNEYDGVPLLNTSLIRPGDTYIASFPIIQHGTYWYHSHTELQEQKGLYGAIVIEPRDGMSTREKTVVLSDFTTQRPHEVLRQVKKHTDWYAINRGAVQSYGKALVTGNLGKQVWMEWNRMPGMDLADLYYDAFLANGELATDFPEAAPGEKVRLRLVNGSASSHFWLHYAGGPLTVVAADGIEVEPVAVDKLLIATAETYDVEVTVPTGGGRYEFRATSWDRYKHTSIWLGKGEDHPATPLGPIDYYALTGEMRDMMKMMPDMVMGRAPTDIPETRVYAADKAPSYQQIQMDAMMKMGMEMDHGQMDHGKMSHGKMDHSQMDHGKTIRASEVDGMQMNMPMAGSGGADPLGVQLTGYTQLRKRFPEETFFDYTMLRATQPTALPEDRPVRIVHLYLGGNMLRYVWMINNEPLSQADKIMIERGENVRFVFHNTTMMSHPMHLHGHFFRVINDQGDYAPLKHTVNVAPMETTIIEFAATEDKDWFFHCHLLYHMMSGMARIIGYEGSTDLLIADRVDYDKFAMEDRQYYGMANLSAQSNGVWADFGYFNTYNEFMLEGEADYAGNFEAETKAMRYLDPKQFVAPYVGLEVEGERVMKEESGTETTETEVSALLGIRYFLPMMIWSDLRVDHRGQFELQLEREDIPLTNRWRASAGGRYNFSSESYEYTLGTSYLLGQYWGVSAKYDSDYGLGAGLQLMW